MRVHHLNCATICPPLGPLNKLLLNEAGHLVCHCLLIESDEGLVLVDTGFSRAELTDPRLLGRTYAPTLRPQPERSAIEQVQALGLRPEDVRHIIVTHLDLDHAGGLVDFPEAAVHLYRPEHEAAMARAGWFDRMRYRTPNWAHGPRWVLHDVAGDRWEGFEAVRGIAGLPPEILLVPLTGHTRGHSGVAILAPDGWLLHCGDAYFYHQEIQPAAKGTFGLNLFQLLDDVDRPTRRLNQERLRRLAQEAAGHVRLFCAHDPIEFAGLRAQAPPFVA